MIMVTNDSSSVFPALDCHLGASGCPGGFSARGRPARPQAGPPAAHPGVDRHYYFLIHVISDDIPVVRIAYARTPSVFLKSRRAHTGSRVRLVTWLVTRAHEPIDV